MMAHGEPKPENATMSNDTSHDYWSAVRSAADDAAESIREFGADPGDALHEAADGSYWVIYYHAAALTLQYSPNDSAIFDECGPQSFDGYGDAITQMAAWAFAADVNESFAGRYDTETGVSLDDDSDEDEDA
jgi:hypothetical protein